MDKPLSPYAKLVKRWYQQGYYTLEDVGTYVESGNITAEEYKRITGEDYFI